MNIAQRIGHLNGAIGQVDAEYLFSKGFTESSSSDDVGSLYKTVTTDEYVVSMVASNGLMSVFVEYADEEYDGEEAETVDTFSEVYHSGEADAAYEALVSYVSDYVTFDSIVTV